MHREQAVRVCLRAAKASERHYRMTERQGRFYQHRYQLDERGREVNILEVEVSYVI
jgi:hypothetical protein